MHYVEVYVCVWGWKPGSVKGHKAYYMLQDVEFLPIVSEALFSPSSPVQFSSLHIKMLIFVFPFSKVAHGT